MFLLLLLFRELTYWLRSCSGSTFPDYVRPFNVSWPCSDGTGLGPPELLVLQEVVLPSVVLSASSAPKDTG